MGTKIAGPGRIGSKESMKKSLKGKKSPFRNIPSEDSLTVRFLTSTDDWHGFYLHWMKDGPIPCTTDDCEGCQSDDEEERRRQFRYLANAYVVDDQKVEAVLIPKTLAEQLFAFQTKYKTLLDRDYELSRTGTGKTGTKYMAVPDSPQKIKMSRFDGKLKDLGKILQSMVNDDVEDDEEDEDEETPKKKSKKSKKPKKSEKNPWDDEPKRRPKKKSASSKKVAKKTVAKRKIRR